jgi:hypothetical protein
MQYALRSGGCGQKFARGINTYQVVPANVLIHICGVHCIPPKSISFDTRFGFRLSIKRNESSTLRPVLTDRNRTIRQKTIEVAGREIAEGLIAHEEPAPTAEVLWR